MTKPEVVVLIPVYNRQASLEKTVASLKDESIAFDIVVVDDGSMPAIKAPPHPARGRLHLVPRECNGGIVAALNTGLKFCWEKDYCYIARIDAGDLNVAGRLQKQGAYLDSHPQCALVGGQVKFFNEKGEPFDVTRLPTEAEEIRRRLHAQTCFFHPAVMMRADIVRKVGGYSSRYYHAEDYYLFLQIALRYPSANLSDTVLLYEFTPESLSQRHRLRQGVSILRLYLRYFDPRLKESYVGVIRKIALLLIPAVLITKAKSILINRSEANR